MAPGLRPGAAGTASPAASLPWHRRVIVLIARLRHGYPGTHPENRFTSNNCLITAFTSPQTQQRQGFAAAKISDSGGRSGALAAAQSRAAGHGSPDASASTSHAAMRKVACTSVEQAPWRTRSGSPRRCPMWSTGATPSDCVRVRPGTRKRMCLASAATSSSNAGGRSLPAGICPPISGVSILTPGPASLAPGV